MSERDYKTTEELKSLGAAVAWDDTYTCTYDLHTKTTWKNYNNTNYDGEWRPIQTECAGAICVSSQQSAWDDFCIEIRSNWDRFWQNIHDFIYQEGPYYGRRGRFTFIDVEGQGNIISNGHTISGGSRKDGEILYHDGAGNVYEWNGDGSDLTVNNGESTLTIQNFHNGDLGIKLTIKPPEPPTPPQYFTTEQANAYWYNILGFWRPSNSPFYSSQGWNTIDTLPWSIGLSNLDTNPDGEGKWLPTFVLGNVPNLSCPIVPFDNTKILEFNQTLTQVA